jgi:hypothetical protein
MDTKNSVVVKVQFEFKSHSVNLLSSDDIRAIVRRGMQMAQDELRGECLDRADDEIWVRCLSIERDGKRMVD